MKNLKERRQRHRKRDINGKTENEIERERGDREKVKEKNRDAEISMPISNGPLTEVSVLCVSIKKQDDTILVIKSTLTYLIFFYNHP